MRCGVEKGAAWGANSNSYFVTHYKEAGNAARSVDQRGWRFSRKANIPSTASGWSMSWFRYRRSRDGKSVSSTRTCGRRDACAAKRKAAAERGRKSDSSQASSCVSRSPPGKTLLTSPKPSAWFAVQLAPVSTISAARPDPTRTGNSAAPAGGNTPSLISGRANCAFFSATIRSHASASSNPPPKHCPLYPFQQAIERSFELFHAEYHSSPRTGLL